MAFDIILAIILIASFLAGYKRGIVYMALFSVGILIGILSALKLSTVTTNFLQSFFESPQAWIPFSSLIINFVLAIWLSTVVAEFVTKLLKLVFLNVINKIIGGLIAAGIAFTLVSIGIWYIFNLNLLPNKLLSQSSSIEYCYQYAPFFIELASSYLPIFKQLFQQLIEEFEYFDENVSLISQIQHKSLC